MSARGEAPGSPDAPDLSYAEALAAIESRGRYGIRLGLGRVRALLRAMGDPQLAVRGALVAGTNGKGSVIALAGSALRAAGYRVGETPKPHLVTYRERIVVDGRPIDAATFAAPRRDGPALRRPDRAAPRAADGVRAPDRRDVPALRARPGWTSRWSRSGWAAAWTRRTPGTAASRC